MEAERLGMQRYLFPALLGLLGAAALLTLGFWQLHRLAWKEGVLAEIEAVLTAPPVALPERPDRMADRYLPVRVSGETVGPELHVLVSTRADGAGFRVVQAFQTVAGRRIMVDRGFVPAASKSAARAPLHATVTGNLHWPDERDRFTPADDPAANFWYARDVDAMALALGTEPVLVIAERSVPQEPDVRPLPLTAAGIPNNHLGYAIQWFGLAAVWLGMSGFWILRLRRRQRG